MPEAFAPPQGSCLAFDFGKARIGVAQGSAQTGTAHPITTIQHTDKESTFAAIGRLLAEWQPDYLVVGLPVHMDGQEHELTRMARKFGQRLYRRFALPVYWADERLSSLYAESLLTEAQVFGRKQKAVLDQVAAQALLYGFFDSGAVEKLDGSGIAGSAEK